MSDISEIDSAPAIIAFVDDPIDGPSFTKTVPQCHTCMHERRQFIETQYVIGRRSREIIELLQTREGQDIGISVAAMDQHFLRQHCTTPQALRLVPQWRKAVEGGLDPQDYGDVASISVSIVKLAAEKIKEELLSDDFTMDWKDRIAILKMNWEMEKAKAAAGGGEYNANTMFIAISIFMAHVQAAFARFAPMDQQEALAYFNRLLEADPILKEIIEQTREVTPELEDFDDDYDPVPGVVDADLVEEEVDESRMIEYTLQADDVDPTEEWEPVELP